MLQSTFKDSLHLNSFPIWKGIYRLCWQAMESTSDTSADVEVVERCSPTSNLRSIASLDHVHHQRLAQALRNVLSTPIAESTFAQIVDGLPLSEIERDKFDRSSVSHYHPLHEKHTELCPGTLSKLRELNSKFKLESLNFGAEVCLGTNYTRI
jgi:hypothetical protein